MDVDLPQEEEYAIGGLSPYSYYHAGVSLKIWNFIIDLFALIMSLNL